MNRSILLFAAIFAVIFGVALAMMTRGNGPAAPETRPAEVAIPDKKEDQPKADEPPPAVLRPLIVNRWALPVDQKAPDQGRGISIMIDPGGPRVLTQFKTTANAWNPVTGATQTTAPLEPNTLIRNTLKDNRPVAHIHDWKSNIKLLELRETPSRTTCQTPDGKRLIVILHPSTYSPYTTINIGTGETKEHAGEYLSNVRLYDIASGRQLGAFGPRNVGVNDDIWAVAASADGKSVFLVNKQDLVELDFQRTFRVAPLPPQPQ